MAALVGMAVIKAKDMEEMVNLTCLVSILVEYDIDSTSVGKSSEILLHMQ